MLEFIIKDFIKRVHILRSMIEDLLHINENGDFIDKYLFKFSQKIQLFISDNFENIYNCWFLHYDLYPEWFICITYLAAAFGPYVIWVAINILVIIILFFWYFTIFLYNYPADKNIDVYIVDIISKIIIKFKDLINLLNFFKFNYDLLFDLFFFILNYFNYTRNSKYNYDMYGNKIVLIKKSSLFLFKNFVYINMYINNIYHHLTLPMGWRTLLTFHTAMDDEEDIEVDEDYNHMIIAPLSKFRFFSFKLRIFNNISKYYIFDRFSKRRRFNFYYNIKRSLIYYLIINIKKLLISLIVISFFHTVLITIFMKILKYITNL